MSRTGDAHRIGQIFGRQMCLQMRMGQEHEFEIGSLGERIRPGWTSNRRQL